ncbi:MAG: DUF1810 domain-containing protein [Burkholderiaceae bacterium]|nr:DUF1810 domain-containing protein [Burkholderiaceae bacterium]
MSPTGPADPYDLDRFVRAQADCHARVVDELSAGSKRSHWMWFVFPQIAGLGHSGMARRYAIRDLDEARAYLRHPVLGPRLLACTRLVNEVVGRSAREIFGTPDDLKFCSSMTLFEIVAEADAPFAAAIDKYYAGRRDQATLARLDGSTSRYRK